MLTVTTDYARIDSDARTNLSLATDAVGRTMRGASINANVPIASAREGSLGFLGEMQLSAMAGCRRCRISGDSAPPISG